VSKPKEKNLLFFQYSHFTRQGQKTALPFFYRTCPHLVVLACSLKPTITAIKVAFQKAKKPQTTIPFLV
jgi:hypothetical protein